MVRVVLTDVRAGGDIMHGPKNITLPKLDSAENKCAKNKAGEQQGCSLCSRICLQT